MPLLKMLLWDVRIQARHNIFTANIFSTAAICGFIFLLPISPLPANLGIMLIFMDPALIGLSFVGAIVLAEKSTKVLSAINMTPTPSWVYVMSKIITFAISGTLAGMVIAYVALETYDPLLMAGVMLLSNCVAVLIGFALVARSQSMNALMIYLLYISTLFFVPLLDLYGVTPEWSKWLMAIIPSHAMLLSIKGAYDPSSITSVEWIYAISYQVLWLFAAWKWSLKEYTAYILSDGR